MARQRFNSGQEKAMAPHFSTLAWKIPWTEEPGGLQSMGSQRVGRDWATSLSCIGKGNGNPLQCSCLENPRDGEPGGLPCMGLHRVGHDWSDLAAAAERVWINFVYRIGDVSLLVLDIIFNWIHTCSHVSQQKHKRKIHRWVSNCKETFKRCVVILKTF